MGTNNSRKAFNEGGFDEGNRGRPVPTYWSVVRWGFGVFSEPWPSNFFLQCVPMMNSV